LVPFEGRQVKGIGLDSNFLDQIGYVSSGSEIGFVLDGFRIGLTLVWSYSFGNPLLLPCRPNHNLHRPGCVQLSSSNVRMISRMQSDCYPNLIVGMNHNIIAGIGTEAIEVWRFKQAAKPIWIPIPIGCFCPGSVTRGWIGRRNGSHCRPVNEAAVTS